MTWFERGRGKDNFTEIDETIDQFRYADFNPFMAINDIYTFHLAANQEGHHLWDSTEQLQMQSVATWMGTSRQLIANTLVNVAEQRSKNGKIPKNQADFALTNYTEARKWLAFRDEVAADEDYELTTPSTFDASISWPDYSPSSSDMLFALKSIVEQLYYIQHPHLDKIVDDTYMKAAFRSYRDALAVQASKLQARIAHIDGLWSADIDIWSGIGQEVYQRLIEATEGLLAFGAQELMPVIANENLRLVKREKIDPNALPAFDARALGTQTLKIAQAEPAQPTLPLLDKSALSRSTIQPDPTPAVPALPAFNPASLQSKQSEHTSISEEKPSPSLSAFNPNALKAAQPPAPTFSPDQLSSLHRPAPSEMAGLPAFDASLLKKSTSVAVETTLPAFNPDLIKNRRPLSSEE